MAEKYDDVADPRFGQFEDLKQDVSIENEQDVCYYPSAAIKHKGRG